MKGRIYNIVLCMFALLMMDACSKRETKHIGGGKGTGSGGQVGEQDDDRPSSSGSGGDEDSSNSSSESSGSDTSDPEDEGSNAGSSDEPETFPEGLSKTEYQQGKKYIGGWDGLADELDSQKKWSLRDKENPKELAGSLGQGGEEGSASNTSVSLADVRPIIQNACASCHSPNGTRPTSPMVTDDQLIAQMTAIKSRVRNNSMPPSGPLPPAEKELIANWSAQQPAASPSPVGTGNQNGQGDRSQTGGLFGLDALEPGKKEGSR